MVRKYLQAQHTPGLKQLNSKKINNLDEKWAKHLNKSLSTEDT
jgi:hypothetical protein